MLLITRKIDVLQRRINEINEGKLYKACEYNLKRVDHAETYHREREFLMSLVIFRLISPSTIVGSEEWDRIINESKDVLNSLHVEIKKMASQINDLRAKLKTLGKE